MLKESLGGAGSAADTHRACHPQRRQPRAQTQHVWGCWYESTRSPCGSSRETPCPESNGAGKSSKGEFRTAASPLTQTTPGEGWAKVEDMLMGTATAPETPSGSWPQCRTLVPKPAVEKSWCAEPAAAMVGRCSSGGTGLDTQVLQRKVSCFNSKTPQL